MRKTPKPVTGIELLDGLDEALDISYAVMEEAGGVRAALKLIPTCIRVSLLHVTGRLCWIVVTLRWVLEVELLRPDVRPWQPDPTWRPPLWL